MTKFDEHAAALKAALGQHFDAKVKFAKKIGTLADDAGDSIAIFHSFRNEVYHIGVQDEAILPAIVRFYFKLSCELLRSYKPSWLGYSPGMSLPERSKKYFGADRFFPGGIEDYQKACKTLGESSVSFKPVEMATALADHMVEVIEEQNIAIEMIATGGPRQYSRDQAIVETFAWRTAFSDEGKKFGREKGFSGSVFQFVTWLAENYPFPFAATQSRAGRHARHGSAKRRTRTRP